MSGRWAEAWDADRQKWVKLYIEEPPSLYTGTAYVITSATDTANLVDPHGKPLAKRKESRRIGFGR